MRHQLLGVVTFVAALAFVVGCGDEKVERAQQFLELGDVDDALKELKLSIKGDPGNEKAQGMLVAAKALKKEKEFLRLFEAAGQYELMQDEDALEKLPEDEREKLRKLGNELRRTLFDVNIDTEDVQGLSNVVHRAAQVIFDLDESKAGRDVKYYAVYVLVLQDNNDAREFLLKELRGKDTDDAADVVEALGSRMIGPLKEAADNPNDLGHDAALKLLPRLYAYRATAEVFDEYENIGTEKTDKAPLEVRNFLRSGGELPSSKPRNLTPSTVRLGPRTFVSEQERRNRRLRVQIEFAGKSGKTALLLISGMDRKTDSFLTIPYVVHKGTMKRLKVKARGKEGDLKVYPAVYPVVRLDWLEDKERFVTYHPVKVGEGSGSYMAMLSKLNTSQGELLVLMDEAVLANDLTTSYEDAKSQKGTVDASSDAAFEEMQKQLEEIARLQEQQQLEQQQALAAVAAAAAQPPVPENTPEPQQPPSPSPPAKEIESLSPTIDAAASKRHLKAGRKLVKNKDYPGSIAEYREAVRLNSSNAWAYAEMSYSLAKTKDWVESEKMARTAIARGGDYRLKGASYYNLGRALEKQGRRGEAIKAFEESLNVRPNNKTVEKKLKELRGY